MFKKGEKLVCELRNPEMFKKLFKGISCTNRDVQIKCNEEGMTLSVININHTVLALLTIEKKYFDLYYCEEEIILNIDVEELCTSLNSMHEHDNLTIKVLKEELFVIFEGDAKRTFKIKLGDYEYKPVKMPTLRDDLEKCELPTELLKKAIDDAFKIRSEVKLSLDSEYFKLNTGEGEFRSLSVEYLHGELVKENHSSSFSTDYVRDCLKSDISDIVGLKIGNFAPLSIIFDIEHVSLEFIIAPRATEV